MPPESVPLLNRGSRARRAELLRQSGLNATGDHLLVTSFDPGADAVRFGRLPDEVLDQLHTVEHFVEPTTRRVVRRKVPLWLRNDGR